jgi:GMP synthase (glutamine-hydrolysing)
MVCPALHAPVSAITPRKAAGRSPTTEESPSNRTTCLTRHMSLSLDRDSVRLEQGFAARGLPRRIVVLQHDQSAPAASFGEWAAARGFEIDVLMAEDAWVAPQLDSVSFVVSLGSGSASYDDALPWLDRELETLTRAHASAVPVFGICFGSQILARSLGAQTRRADAPEIGWYEVDTSNPAAIPRGPWLFWHEDCFELPQEAELLAKTSAGPAAFRVGASIGVQFHPEVTPELLEAWISESESDLEPAVRKSLRRKLGAESAGARERAWRLYDAFLLGAAHRLTQST